MMAVIQKRHIETAVVVVIVLFLISKFPTVKTTLGI